MPVVVSMPRRRLQQSGALLLATRGAHRLFTISKKGELHPLQADVMWYVAVIDVTVANVVV